jgi:hypothetical protein
MNKLYLIVIVLALGSYIYLDLTQQIKPIVYGESRFTFQIPGREIELVTIGQRIGMEDCLEMRDLVFQQIDAVCNNEKICYENKNYECKTTVDAKYQDMLDQQPSRTHYLHVKQPGENLNGVILYWGMTENESWVVCNMMVEKMNKYKQVESNTQCI